MSINPYPKYKDSGVEWLGMVPEHWEVKPLKHLAGIDSCGCYGTDLEEGGEILRVATTAQIDSSGRFDVERMPERGFSAAEVSRYGCSAGDILVVKSSGSATNIISGKAGLVDEATPKFIFSNFLMRVRTQAGAADPQFIYALLRSNLTRQRVELMCSTTTYPNLQIGEYVSAPLPVPPIAEQSAIASFLDHETSKIDALISEQEKLIELLKEKRSAVISHAVTKGLNPDVKMKDSGVEWLGMVPEHWEVLKLGRIASTKGGAGFPDEYQGQMHEELPFFKVGDISSCGIDGVMHCPNHTVSHQTARNLRATVFDSGTIVFAKVGAALLLQRYRQLGQPSCIDNNMMGMTSLPNVVQEYLLSILPLLDLKTIVNPGAVPSINESQISGQKVALPPRVEQIAIVEKLKKSNDKSDNLIRESESAINLLQERRSALISAAVTGQIDVRNFAPSKAA